MSHLARASQVRQAAARSSGSRRDPSSRRHRMSFAAAPKRLPQAIPRQLGRGLISSLAAALNSSGEAYGLTGCPPGDGRPFLTLERSIGARDGKDRMLWDTGLFDAEVYPDLPLATSWAALGQAILAGRVGNDAGMDVPVSSAQPGKRLVRTVGVQCRSKSDLRAHVLQQALGTEDVTASEAQPADALLCVSGSHPMRLVPGLNRMLPSSVDALLMAEELRRDGSIPPALELWAVANPLMEMNVAKLKAKVDAGAQVVVTQPPLDWANFDRWVNEADREGIWRHCKLVVGLPFLSSSGNASFWLQLCGASSTPWASGLKALWSDAESKDKAEFQNWRMEQHREMLRHALELPGVAGLHVMPLTKTSREDATALLLDSSSWWR